MDQSDKWDDAYLNGIPIQCETIEDRSEKALAVHELPDQDRVILEDMGLKAWKVRLRCYFWDETYDNHSLLLGELRNQKSFELDHPAYGLMQGSVESIAVRHDDRLRTAEIDISFVEGETESEPVLVMDVKGETETAYVEGLSQAQDTFQEDVKEGLGAEASGILSQTLDPQKGILEQFTGISRLARNYVKTVDGLVSRIEAKLQTITTPANALVSTINFSTNLPGRVLGAIARVASRYSTLCLAIEDAPDRFIQSYKDGITALENELFTDDAVGAKNFSPLLKKAFKSVTALEAGAQVGSAFSADEQARLARKDREYVKSFDALGKYLNPEPLEPVMDVREIETTLYMVREMLADAVADARQNQALKDMALSLERHAVEIKIERAKIKTVTLDNAMPLHLVCLKYGLPYNMADRILALNTVKNPNYCTGDVDIYYA